MENANSTASLMDSLDNALGDLPQIKSACPKQLTCAKVVEWINALFGSEAQKVLSTLDSNNNDDESGERALVSRLERFLNRMLGMPCGAQQVLSDLCQCMSNGSGEQTQVTWIKYLT